MSFKFFILILAFFLSFKAYSQGDSSAPACLEAIQKISLDKKDLKSALLEASGKLREEFKGMGGYVRLAEQHFESDMRRAFANVSAVLNKALFKQLGWQQFQGAVLEYKALKSQILNEEGELREEFIGMGGYVRLAEQHFKSDMRRAFLNVSAFLNEALFERLGWQQFHGAVLEYKALKSQILNEEGELREEFIGMGGYVRLAEQHFESNMLRAFTNVSAVLDKALFKRLGWRAFQGAVLEYEALKSQILNEEGELREEFIGIKGYARFAEQYFESDMGRAFLDVSAGLNKALFKQLGWQQFQGAVLEYKALKSQILNEKGVLREEFIGMEGYARFAEQYFESDMRRAFLNVSVVLDKALFRRLGWQAFQGAVSEYEALKSQILNKEGELREEFIGMEGYARFAEQYFESNMRKAFFNVSAVLDKALFRRLGWQYFQGAVLEYKALKFKILNEKGVLREEFIGMEGYARFAEQYFESNMRKAFANVSAVLDKALFRRLGWQAFQGAVLEYKALKFKILNEEEELREEFIGMEGCARFAEQYFESDMSRAFADISAVLDKDLFKKLNWKKFQGKAYEFHKLIKDFIENYPQLYESWENQKRLADKIFKGNTKKTYGNMSVLRGYFFGEDKKQRTWIKHIKFKELNWINQ